LKHVIEKGCVIEIYIILNVVAITNHICLKVVTITLHIDGSSLDCIQKKVIMQQITFWSKLQHILYSKASYKCKSHIEGYNNKLHIEEDYNNILQTKGNLVVRNFLLIT
jgi:hypothetical protein